MAMAMPINNATYTITESSKHVGLEVDRLYGNLLNILSKPLGDSSNSCQIKDLLESKEKSEKELNEARTALHASRQKIDKLVKECEGLQKQSEEQNNKDYEDAKKRDELKSELILLQNTKMNSHDEELLGKTKFQYKCIRNMTQVRFIFNKSNDDILEGCVFNNATKKVISFSIKISEDGDQARKQLLKIMKDASHPSYAQIPFE